MSFDELNGVFLLNTKGNGIHKKSKIHQNQKKHEKSKKKLKKLLKQKMNENSIKNRSKSIKIHEKKKTIIKQ